ncbi:MAG: LacI family DNA-binding transcriptional regulator [Blautia sp.]
MRFWIIFRNFAIIIPKNTAGGQVNNFRSVRNLRGKSVVKIKDVARETGLSISTISKYMNGIKVRKENEERIQAAINELGYQPNEFARGLRTAKTYTIGVLVYRLQNIFSGKIAGNLESYLRKKRAIQL